MHVVGARPNFMKLSPVYAALSNYSDIHQIVVHTGQHYSHNMSQVFFDQLGLPAPDFHLDISGGSVLHQIGTGLLKIETILHQCKPDLLCVYGDVNATAFSSIAASKLGIKIAHIEAGLRSNDWGMPEETNRIIADALSNYFFTPSIDANENLIKEGKKTENIFLVGNVMIDTLVKFLPTIEKTPLSIDLAKEYLLLTLHRPSNVDSIENLKTLFDYLQELSQKYQIIFPVHPRTKNLLQQLDLQKNQRIIITEPLDYFQFIKIQKQATFIITDSGGVQEESTFLKVPCFTLRDNTERPITVTEGTNTLVGSDINALKKHILDFEKHPTKKSKIPKYWDGKTGTRIAQIISNILS
jgi:UDP-N-acetylglucosamine 2-epimerase (non-hydrolysing)